MEAYWRIHLVWAALGVARDPIYWLTASTVYVLKEGGPNWAEQLTAWATLAAAVGVIAAIIGALIARSSLRATLTQVRLAAQQVNEAEKLRNISLVVEMARRWDDKTMIEVRHEIGQMPSDEFRDAFRVARTDNEKRYFDWLILANYFEDFGAMVAKECLDLAFVQTTIGGSVLHYWGKWRDPVNDQRTADDDPELFDNWENLAIALGFSPAEQGS